MCEKKGSRKRRIGLKEFEHVVFINRAGSGKWRIKENKGKSKVVCRQENVALGMSKNLVGVGDP